jgi:hypothetical protein
MAHLNIVCKPQSTCHIVNTIAFDIAVIIGCMYIFATQQVILLEHDIPHEAFSGKVLACLPPVDWQVCIQIP